MKLLLDTHIWLWSLLEPDHLTRRVSKALQDPENELWLSPVSVWEFILLCEKKRIALEEDPSTWVQNAFELAPIKEAPLTYDVALALSHSRLPHRDPADRFLVATADVYGLTLVTADERLISSKLVPTLANIGQ